MGRKFFSIAIKYNVNRNGHQGEALISFLPKIWKMMEKVGRNDPCPCGSGKKYKNCHYGKEQEGKKTYTADGKRKFKATVISATDKSQSVFQGTSPAPRAPSEAPPIDLLKFKLSKNDYRVREEKKAEVPFELPEHERMVKPSIEHELPKEVPGEFKPATEDFRKKEGE
jgi:hypothetical protein